MRSLEKALIKLRKRTRSFGSFDASGRMRPQVIHWVDGRRYEISRVKAIVPAAARKSGGQGDRYTVMLAGQERYLFFERPTDERTAIVGRWFVEATEGN